MSSILIKDAHLVTVNPKNETIREGSMYIEGNRIVALGKSDSVRERKADFVIEGKGKVVLPGLVNTHVHLAQAVLRGLVPDYVSGLEWLRDWTWPFQGIMTPDEAEASTRLALLEMLDTGTTTFLATSINGRYDVDRVISAVHSSGIRSAIGRQIMNSPGYADQPQVVHPGLVEDAETSFKSFEEMYKKWNDKDERIWVWLSPRTPGAISDELFGRIAQTALEHHSGITMHLAEIKEDVAYFKGRGTTPAKFLEKFGMTGPKFVYIHCVFLEEGDMEVFARTGTSVSHNPSSNSKGGSGIAKVVKMLKTGVNVALGTDGGPSNDSYDLLREIKTALILQKADNLDPRAINLMTGVRMATINGAKALGIDHLVGSLEVGKRADIAVYDLHSPNLTPSTISPLNNLVYAGAGSCASHVIVDGKFVKKDGRVLSLKGDEIIDDANRLALAIYQRANKKNWQ
jgi:cytosine/adenosine deaminase-related metal-dependent hydrolase